MKKGVKAKKTLERKRYGFTAYGVRLAVEADRDEDLLEVKMRLRTLLPGGVEEIDPGVAEHSFEINREKNGLLRLSKSGQKIGSVDQKEVFFRYLSSILRLTVAEYASEKVFIHAGVVGWKGKAIVIPGRSFQGKTTLVKELTRQGAIYYSDEYAVLDRNGLVHPFPKTLSVRGVIGEFEQTEMAVESLGGKAGDEPLEVGMICLTEYKKNARWRPRILSPGKALLEMLSHTIPIRYNPQFSLNVLNKTLNHAIIVKTKRGEAKHFALKILKYFEEHAFPSNIIHYKN